MEGAAHIIALFPWLCSVMLPMVKERLGMLSQVVSTARREVSSMNSQPVLPGKLSVHVEG